MRRRTEDLSREWALEGCRTIDFEGGKRPCIGRIALLARLGRGGTGVVYYGINPRLRTEVALKLLPRRMQQEQEDAVERFLREARLAARLTSDHLVTVLDVDHDEATGAHYIVMEYVRGRSARQWIERLKKAGQKAPEADALDICIAATKGLEAAHLEGVLHRDVKPHNILVPAAEDGGLAFARAKLADLGLARIETPDQEITTSRIGMGTPGYLAPEQARDARVARKPADVFGVGATLYALLAGEPPYRGSTPIDSVVRAMKGSYRPLREVRPEVSPGTETLLKNCLAPKPERRFPDASALLEALQVCRKGLDLAPEQSAAAAQAMSGIVRRKERGKAVEAPVPRRRPAARARRRTTPAPLAIVLVVLALAAAFVVFRGGGADEGLRVDSTPRGATVRIDGEVRGTTPCLVEVTGTVSVAVELEGHEPFREDRVSVAPGEVVTLHPVLHAAATGLAVHTTPPGATVTVNGRPRGRTGSEPLVLRDLALGAFHTVVVTLEDHEPYRKNDVVLREGERTTLRVTLKRARGSLTLAGGAPGAEIRVDGAGRHAFRLDDAGRLAIELDAGRYRLLATRAGFDPVTLDVVIRGGAAEARGLAMREHAGRLSVDSKPPGARVLLGGRELGTTPVRAHEVPAGTHTVTLRLAEHVDAVRSVEVRGDETADLGVVALQPWATLDLSDVGEGVSARIADRPVADGARVPPGPVEIVLTRADHAEQRLTLAAAVGAALAVRPAPWATFQARLDLRGLPSDVRVRLDGQDAARALHARAAGGEMLLELARPGFAEETRTVLLELGKTVAPPAIAWRPVKTHLDLSDYPAQAIFHVRGRRYGDGAVLPPGRYDGYVRLAGKRTRVKTTLDVVSQPYAQPPLPRLEAEPVRRALAWLARHQSTDGRWDSDGYVGHCEGDACEGTGRAVYDVGLTGLGLLCFLHAGETGGEAVTRALAFLRSVQDADGCFGARSALHFMYNHACAALAVAQAYRLTRDPALRAPVERAVAFVQDARNPFLAWRYKPRGGENDTSVTCWMARVLKIAERAGLDVDKEAYAGTLSWLDKMTDPDFGKVGYNVMGGPSGRPGEMVQRFPAEQTGAMTAAAIGVRLALGAEPDAESVDLGTRLCLELPPKWAGGRVDFYYWYHGTIALARVGGRPWQKWSEALKQATLPHQRAADAGSPAGSWDPEDPWAADGGRLLSTMLLCLALEQVYRWEHLQ